MPVECPDHQFERADAQELGRRIDVHSNFDAGRALLALIEDALDRCRLLATTLNGGLPSLAQSLNTPLMSPGPYDIGTDTPLMLTCDTMSAELLELRSALREAVALDSAAYELSSRGSSRSLLEVTMNVSSSPSWLDLEETPERRALFNVGGADRPPHPPQPPSPPPTPSPPSDLALEQAFAARLLEPRCPAADCPPRTVFLGCGSIDTCTSSINLVDGVWASPSRVLVYMRPRMDLLGNGGMLEGANRIRRSRESAAARLGLVSGAFSSEAVQSMAGPLREWLAAQCRLRGYGIPLCTSPQQ